METSGDSQRKPNLNKAVLEGERIAQRREDTMHLIVKQAGPILVLQERGWKV